MKFVSRFHLSLLALSIASLSAPVAKSATILFSGFSSDGHPVSASADITLNDGADTATVKLTNTTATTLDAGELFTGLDFSIGGLSMSMTSDTGIQRDVDDDGDYVDTGSAQDLSWSLVSQGAGVYQLNFNPNAEDAIIGPPTSGDYSGANGSIKGNNGHNPFAAEMAVFELSIPGLEPDSVIDVSVFRFGTNLDPGVPEPATVVLAVLGLASMGWMRRRRR